MHYVRFVSTDRITIAVLLIYTASIIILPGAVAAAADCGDSSDHLRYAVPKHNYTHLIILDNACN